MVYSRTAGIVKENRSGDVKVNEFTKKDTVCSMYTAQPGVSDSNIGKVAVLPYDFFKEEYRKPENQLFRLESGFGTSSLGVGNACYGHFCVDGEKCRIEKYKFIGIGNAQVQNIGTQLESVWQNRSVEDKKTEEME